MFVIGYTIIISKYNIMKGYKKADSRNCIFIREKMEIKKVYTRDILWIKALGDYVTLHTKTNKYILRSTLEDIGKAFPQISFCGFTVVILFKLKT